MSTLYRLFYLEGDTPKGVTFGAEDLVSALEFMELYEKMLGRDVLTMKPLGNSYVNANGSLAQKERISHRFLKEGIWPTSIVIYSNRRAKNATQR